MNKSFTKTCKQDLIDLIRNQEYQDSLWDTYDFTTYGSGHPQMPILSHDGYNIRDDDGLLKSKTSMLHRKNRQTGQPLIPQHRPGTR